jgi:hypothetical protein
MAPAPGRRVFGLFYPANRAGFGASLKRISKTRSPLEL